MMSEYNAADTWDDVVDVKIEEEEMESDKIRLPQNKTEWNGVELFKLEGQESEHESSADNFCLAKRSVAVQTEDSMQEAISSNFPHLSVQQIHTFLDLLATILVRTKESQQTTNQMSENSQNTITEVSKRARKSGWISLEPDLKILPHKQEGWTNAQCIAVNQFNHKSNSKCLDKQSQDSFSHSTLETPVSQLNFANLSSENSDPTERKNNDSPYKIDNERLPQLTTISNNIPKDCQHPLLAVKRTVTAFVPYRLKKVSMDSNESIAYNPTLSRDEQSVRDLRIGCSVDFIINSSTDQFNDLLIKTNEDQRNLCRDIRKRGKNKIAAQNCRKRKYELTSSLEEELQAIQVRKEMINKENVNLMEIHRKWKEKIRKLEQLLVDSSVTDLSENFLNNL